MQIDGHKKRKENRVGELIQQTAHCSQTIAITHTYTRTHTIVSFETRSQRSFHFSIRTQKRKATGAEISFF